MAAVAERTGAADLAAPVDGKRAEQELPQVGALHFGAIEALGDAASKAWENLDGYPFIRAVADRMREHADREQFLTGITTLC